MRRCIIGHLAKADYHLVAADVVSTEGTPEGSIIVDSNGAVVQAAETVILSLPDGKTIESVCQELIVASTSR